MRENRWLTWVIAASLAMAACSSATPSTSTKIVSGKSIIVRTSGAWKTFDPQRQTDGVSGSIYANGYDTLLALTPAGKLVPYLATSYTVESTASGGTSYIFKLHTDATCVDGTAVTPQVVKASIDAGLKTAIVYKSAFNGGGPFTTSADQSADTFTFTTTAPYGALLYAFANGQTGIVCPAGLANPSIMDTQFAGSGPYTVASASHTNGVVLKLRPDWKWGPEGITAATPGLPGTVTMMEVDSETTAANLLLTGGLDLSSISGPDVQRLAANNALTESNKALYGTMSLVFNQASGHPTDDDSVRAAIMTAVSAAGWNQAANAGLGVTSTSIVTPNTPCFDTTTANLVPKTDVSAARKILTDAGWTYSNNVLTKNGQQLGLSILSSTTENQGGPYLQTQLTSVGFAVTLNNTDRVSYVTKVLAGNFDVSYDVAQIAVPYIGLQVKYFTGTAIPNLTFKANQQLIKEANAAAAVASPTECQLWNIYQEDLLKQHWIMPLAAPDLITFASHVQLPSGGLNPPNLFYPQLMWLQTVA